MDQAASIGEWKARAARAMRSGNLTDGLEAYRALIAGGEDDGASWYNLGYLLRCARQFEDALDAYAQALARGIDRGEEVMLNRAVILSECLDREAEAEAELRRAVAMAPRFVPAWLNLGNLYEDRADAAAAVEAYEQVLAIDPDNGRALARVATIGTFAGQASAMIPRLRQALARPNGDRSAMAEIGFALGNALDAEGRYDEAFAAFSLANRTAQAAAHPAYPYDRRRQEQLIDGLIHAYPLPAPIDAGDGPSPIFICGMFRSGSTLIEQMLSRHSRITRGGELEIVPALAAQLAGAPPPSPDAIAAMRTLYRNEIAGAFSGADRLTDKRPDNFLHIGLIKRLFPDAKIINTVRDARDTALSIFFLYFDDSIAYGHNLGDIAHWITQYRRLMGHWHTLYPGDILDVSYDQIVRDPEPTLRDILSLCGLDWEEQVLSPEHADGPVRTASAWQVRQRLHQRSSGRWRHYAQHLPAAIRALEQATD